MEFDSFKYVAKLYETLQKAYTCSAGSSQVYVVQILTVQHWNYILDDFQARHVAFVMVDTLDRHRRRQSNWSTCQYNLISRAV